MLHMYVGSCIFTVCILHSNTHTYICRYVYMFFHTCMYVLVHTYIRISGKRAEMYSSWDDLVRT